MKKAKYFFSFLLITGIIACQTYHISTQSLLEQCANIKKEKKTVFFIAPPFIFAGSVTGNDLKELKCYDDYEKEKVIHITNHTGIRITKKDNSQKTFYFNTLIIHDSVITGENTHFFNSPIKPIKLDDIAKIELEE